MAPRTKQKPAVTVKKKSLGVKIALYIFIVGAVSVISAIIWSKGWIPHTIHVSFDAEPQPLQLAVATTPTPATKQSPQISATPQVKPVVEKSYQNADATLINPAPDGWKVDHLDGIKIRVGPIKFSTGKEASFIVPAYQFVPISREGGVYLIEPGYSTGMTLPNEIDKISDQINTARDDLDNIDAALGELKKITQHAPVSGSNNTAAIDENAPRVSKINPGLAK